MIELSIFDYFIKPKELKYLRIYVSDREYLTTVSKMKRLYDLYMLLVLREHDKEAKLVMDEINVQITNPAL